MTNNLSLTASESLSLWNCYLSESMTFNVSKYFHSIAEDPQVKKMLEFAVGISEEGVKTSKRFLEQAGHPLPEGFNENDVNWDAPKVYSDAFCYAFKKQARAGFISCADTFFRRFIAFRYPRAKI